MKDESISLVQAFGELDEIAMDAGVKLDVEQLSQQLRTGRTFQHNILVTGCANSGKTFFINNLLQLKPRLPVGPIPSNQTITLIPSKSESYYEVNGEGHYDITHFNHIKENCSVNIYTHSDFLNEVQARLTEDCHGLQSDGSSEVTSAVISYLLPYDLVILVTSALHPFAAPDALFLRICSSIGVPVHLIVCGMELLDDEEETAEVKQYIEKKAAKLNLSPLFLSDKYAACEIRTYLKEQLGLCSYKHVKQRFFIQCCEDLEKRISILESKAKLTREQENREKEEKEIAIEKQTQCWNDFKLAVKEEINNLFSSGIEFVKKQGISFGQKSVNRLKLAGDSQMYVSLFQEEYLPGYIEQITNRMDGRFREGMDNLARQINIHFAKFRVPAIEVANRIELETQAGSVDTAGPDINAAKRNATLFTVGTLILLPLIGIAAPVLTFSAHLLGNKYVNMQKAKAALVLEPKIADVCNRLTHDMVEELEHRQSSMETYIEQIINERQETWLSQRNTTNRMSQDSMQKLIIARTRLSELKNKKITL